MAKLNEIGQVPLFGNGALSQPAENTNGNIQPYLIRLNELDIEIAEIENQLATMPIGNELEVNKYRAGAEAIREYDPEMAMKYSYKADQLELAEKNDQLKRDIAEAKAIANKDPEKARIRLMQILDNYIAMRNTALAKNLPTTDYDNAINAIQKGLRSNNPNIQEVFSDFGDFGDLKGKGSDESLELDGSEESGKFIPGENLRSRNDQLKNAKSLKELESMQIEFAGNPITLNTDQQNILSKTYNSMKNKLTPKSRPKKSTPETAKELNNYLQYIIKTSEASKLDPENAGDRLLLAKIKSRGYANEAYMSDDAQLSGGLLRQALASITGVRELPLEDAIAYRKQIKKDYDKYKRLSNEVVNSSTSLNNLSQTAVDKTNRIISEFTYSDTYDPENKAPKKSLAEKLKEAEAEKVKINIRGWE